MNLEAFGGRRFLMTMGCGVATTALTWFEKISGEIYAAVIIATVAAYITGNGVQKAVERMRAPPVPGEHETGL